MFRVLVKTSAQKNLKKVDPRYQKRLILAMDSLRQDPFLGKSLMGELAGFHSLRVWPYRIIYQVMKAERVIFVVAVEHRQSAYS